MPKYRNGRPIDPQTNAALMIGYPHHEIHDGSMFTAHHSVTLSGNNDRVVLVTPATSDGNTKKAHMTFGVSADGKTTFGLYEDTTRHSTGAAITTFNVDRNSANTAGLLATQSSSTAGLDGTLLYQSNFGTGGNTPGTLSGGADRSASEYILKQNTAYLVLAASTTDSNVEINLRWYEHTSVVGYPSS